MASAQPGRADSAIDVEIGDDASDESIDSPLEEAPLLPNDLPPEIVPGKSFQRRVVLMCITFLFTIEVSQFVMEPPTQKIMEDIICRGYYPDHLLRMPRIQDGRCKNTDVQKTLAMVRGWPVAVELAAPILVQFPFGIIADKYGRRIVLFLSLFGVLLQTIWTMVVLLFPNVFPIWAILLGNIFALIGGGGPMAAAMVWTIVADVVPTAERTAVFYQMNALILILNIVVNPISAFLMGFDPWIAMWLGFGFLVLEALATLLIPETLKLRQKADDRRHHDQQDQGETEPLGGNELAPDKDGILKTAWFTVKNDMGHVWRFIFASKSIMLLIVSYAAYFPVRLAGSTIQLQYISKRFRWEWSEATYVSTIGTIVSAICLLAILPMVSSHLTKRFRLSPVERDLYLSRGSITLAVLGILIMSWAAAPWLYITSLMIFSLGSGFNPLCRALLNAVVEPHTIATLNTTISLIEMIMGLAGAPALAWLLSRGIELGGAWYGLPFLALTGLLTGVAVVVFRFNVPVGVAQAHSS